MNAWGADWTAYLLLEAIACAVSGAVADGDNTSLRRMSSAQLPAVEGLAKYEEGEPIQINWSGELVVWSFLISCIGAYVALTSALVYVSQVRGTHWYLLLVLQAALSLGVGSVWAMHFVGMYALELRSPGKPRIELEYEPIFTIVSGLAAWLITSIALHIILSKNHFGNSDDVEKRLKMLSSREKLRWFWVKMPVRRLVVSTSLVSVGVVVMHYMGMLSQTGNFRMEFNPWNIFASGAVAYVAAWAALPIIIMPFDSVFFRFGASLGIGIFVNSMHYTGMTAATYTFSSVRVGIFGENTTSWHLYYKDIVIFTFILDLCLMGVTGYYVEVAREIVKMNEAEVENKLAFVGHKRNVGKLVKASRIMTFPMSLLRYETFAKLGKLVAHEVLRDAHKLVYFNTVKSVLRLKKQKNHIVFFSHQWLSHGLPDPADRHYRDMLTALQSLAQMFRVKLDSLYVFVDYSSIPQDGAAAQQLAIDSLATYVSLSSAFIIVSPQTLHRDTQSLCNFDTYSNRFWCRLEVFCTMLSSLRQKELIAVQKQIVEEEHEDDDAQGTSGNAAEQLPTGTSSLSGMARQQRVFVVVEDSLHPLNFFTPAGALQPRYHDLFRLFEGQATCCERGHAEGEEHRCDKCRVVESLTGAYGAMLQDVRKFKRNELRATSNQGPTEHLMLVEEIVRQRAAIFPERYFESRIDAVHARLDARASLFDDDAGDDHGKAGAEDLLAEDVSDPSDSDSDKQPSTPSLSSSDQEPEGLLAIGEPKGSPAISEEGRRSNIEEV